MFELLGVLLIFIVPTALLMLPIMTLTGIGTLRREQEEAQKRQAKQFRGLQTEIETNRQLVKECLTQLTTLRQSVAAPATSRSGSLSPPSILRKLLVEAQASSSVPSTEKWSDEISRFTRGWASTAAKNLAAISPARSRSRFVVKLEWSQAASSTPRPTNQRNSRSNSIRSISCRSERIP